MEVVVPAPKESRQKLSDMMMAAEGMAVNPMAIPKVSVTIAKNEAIPKMWPVWSSIRQWASHGERCEGHSDHKEQEEEPAAEHHSPEFLPLLCPQERLTSSPYSQSFIRRLR